MRIRQETTADYYPRFGLRAGFNCPDSCYMAQELTAGGLSGVQGVVHYAEGFFVNGEETE